MTTHSETVAAGSKTVTTAAEAPGQTLKACRTTVAVGLRVLLPGVYLTWRQVVAIAAALALGGGVIDLAGIANGRRGVPAEECPGGALRVASADVAA